MSESLPKLILQRRLTRFFNPSVMKRFILSATLILMSLCFGGKASAGNFGVLGGANFYTSSIKEINAKTMTQWHAGVTYKIELPVGFQLQPALLYNVKGANFNMSQTDLSVGYLELMASVQWGVDLILFRPFVDVSPFVGYGLNGAGSLKDIWKESANKLEYGVGVGGGLQVWRFQIAARYNWNLGRLFEPSVQENPLGKANFNGVTLSLGFFF